MTVTLSQLVEAILDFLSVSTDFIATVSLCQLLLASVSSPGNYFSCRVFFYIFFLLWNISLQPFLYIETFKEFAIVAIFFRFISSVESF